MRSEAYSCDVCKAPRLETNHWWLMSYQPVARVLIRRWDWDEAKDEGIIHLCGQECVNKKVSEFLSKTS